MPPMMEVGFFLYPFLFHAAGVSSGACVSIWKIYLNSLIRLFICASENFGVE